MKNIDCIILHYGDIELTKRCVESIVKYAPEIRTIYLVNNDTAINLQQKLGKGKKRVYLSADKNRGFAGGVNIGIKEALKNNAHYIIIINNDAYVQHNFLVSLYQALEEDSKVGIAGPVITFLKNRTTYYDHGGYINTLFGRTSHDNRLIMSQKTSLDVNYVSGCCMMIKREVFEKIGVFDEDFFMYYEDVDFCLRAKNVGFQTVVVPNSVIHHDLSKTIGKDSSKALFHQIRSQKLFYSKHPEYIFGYFSLFFQMIKFSIKKPQFFPVIIQAGLK